EVEQIAILRGPQGTTLGRNVVGGGQHITSRRAELGIYEGRLSLTGQSIDDHPGFGAQGYVNLPFGDDLAARFAFSTKDHEGYQENLVTGNELADNRIWSFRSGLTYAATDTLKLTSLFSVSRRNNRGDGPAVSGDGALAAQQQAADPDLHQVFVDADGRTERSIFSAMLRADWDMALGTLSSITGYRTLDAELDEDADGSLYPLNAPSLNTNDEWQFSQELRLTSLPGETFDYIAGLYYGFENLNHAIVFNFDGTIEESFLSVLLQGAKQSQTVVGEAHTLSLGPYFEGTWHITETFDATAGIRYVYEDKTGYTEHIGTSIFYGGPYRAELDESWSEWTPRLILEYKPRPELLFYASASNGFQSGGWTLTARTPEAAQIPLEPEKTWSYELGTKSSWFGGRLTTNIAAYQAITEDLQVRSLVNGVLTDSNAGEAEVKGVELELAGSPLDGLVLGANYAYTDAEYSSYDGCATRPNPNAGQEGEPPVLPVSCTGNTLPFTPEHDLSLFLTYDWLLAGGDVLTLRIDDKISSEYELTPTGGQQRVVPLTERSSILNGSLTYAAADERWSVQFWGRNLTDELIVTNGLAYSFYLLSPQEVQALGGLGNADAQRVSVAPPRTLGVTLAFQFQ
ncbi:MAG: TonB-dependent receptor, partial [Gammaproteobacteria bacterium]